jgi:hypothetical protein
MTLPFTFTMLHTRYLAWKQLSFWSELRISEGQVNIFPTNSKHETIFGLSALHYHVTAKDVFQNVLRIINELFAFQEVLKLNVDTNL